MPGNPQSAIRNLQCAALAAALALCCSVPLSLCLAQDADKDVSWKAKDEIARRGAFVEYVNGIQQEPDALIGELLAPPEDDSHKWLFTLVTTRGCAHCDRLRGDFEHAPVLQAWVNVKDYKKSWAHYQVVQIEDGSQAWRWKDFKPTQFPTLIVQPPVDRSWGDPHTIVFLQVGYDGRPDKLAAKLRAALDAYAKKVAPQHSAWKRERAAKLAQAGRGGFQQAPQAPPAPVAGPFSPPVTPPSPLPPAPPGPQNFPPDPTPAAGSDLVMTLLVGLVKALFPSASTILLVLLTASNVWMAYRETAKQAGLQLLVDDATAQKIADLLKAAGGPNSRT